MSVVLIADVLGVVGPAELGEVVELRVGCLVTGVGHRWILSRSPNQNNAIPSRNTVPSMTANQVRTSVHSPSSSQAGSNAMMAMPLRKIMRAPAFAQTFLSRWWGLLSSSYRESNSE